MFIKQVSVFVENKSGKIADVIKILSDHKINMYALSVADSDTFGILRLIVEKPEEAYKALKANNITVKITRVIGVNIDNNPGGLSSVLALIKENGIDVNYLYAFSSKVSKDAIVLMRFNEDEKALEVLKKNNVSLVNPDALYKE